MTGPCLYLIPVPIAEHTLNQVIPEEVLSKVKSLKFFIAENGKTARKFFKLLGMEQQSISVFEIDKHHPESDVEEFLAPLKSGNDMGLLSESGMPAIADPGAIFVGKAHQLGYKVKPLTGPNSLMLALAASGLSGQQFCFHGYLPKESGALQQRLLQLEKESKSRKQAQIVIETPFRNESLFQKMLAVFKPATLLTVAVNITAPDENIQCRKIQDWKKCEAPSLKNLPAVFVFQA